MSIIGLQRRLAPAGRIRIGEQVPTSGGKTRPSKLSAFRFTSSNRRAIEAVAALYGGEAAEWAGAPTEGQWEVCSESSEIPVVVPPERMAFSQAYEVWSGGGCKRRCDGQFDQISDGPCLCDPENRECKPYTRLSVMLAKLSGIGLWRLDTKGWFAAEELGGSFEIADMLSKSLGRSVLPGILRLEQRVTKKDGKTNKFAVPVLDFDVDMGALALGYTTTPSGEMVPVNATPERPSLTPVPSDEAPVPTVSQQLAEAGAPVRARSNAAEPVKPTALPLKRGGDDPTDPARKAQKDNLHRLFGLKGVTDRSERLAYCVKVIDRALASSNELTAGEADTLIAQLKVEVGEEPPMAEEAS